jgi:hypothetical protein
LDNRCVGAIEKKMVAAGCNMQVYWLADLGADSIDDRTSIVTREWPIDVLEVDGDEKMFRVDLYSDDILEDFRPLSGRVHIEMHGIRQEMDRLPLASLQRVDKVQLVFSWPVDELVERCGVSMRSTRLTADTLEALRRGAPVLSPTICFADGMYVTPTAHWGLPAGRIQWLDQVGLDALDTPDHTSWSDLQRLFLSLMDFAPGAHNPCRCMRGRIVERRIVHSLPVKDGRAVFRTSLNQAVDIVEVCSDTGRVDVELAGAIVPLTRVPLAALMYTHYLLLVSWPANEVPDEFTLTTRWTRLGLEERDLLVGAGNIVVSAAGCFVDGVYLPR